ncbi:MAG: tetratricopeptide repeat-containing glycosyltransferase family protein [Pirellulales bacterium]
MPTVGEALQQARAQAAAGQFAEAEALLRRLTELLPEAAEVWGELGIFYLQAQRPDAAVDPLAKATALAPGNGGYFGALGATCRLLNRHAEAVAAFQRALDIGPPTPELYGNLALAQKDAQRFDEALDNIDRALAIRFDYQTGHFNRGKLLLAMSRPREAVASLERAVQLDPHDAGAHCSLGLACYELARWDAALAAFDRALALQPGYHEARRNQALVWFQLGEYRKAWPAFESRFECDDFARREFAVPRWGGSSLAGRTLYVHAEQGLGDGLQFVRYLRLATRLAGRVWYEPHEALRPLLAQSGFGDLLAPAGTSPTFDTYASLLSLPGHLPDERGEPYWSAPYLQAERRLVEHWRTRLHHLQGYRVGITWAGNPQYGYDRYRSTRLANFEPLGNIPGVHLISLQLGAGRKQLAELAGRINVLDLGDELDVRWGAFMDTAAVIENLDLVISVDTAITHLAGAMGRPVWVALPRVPDWRWTAAGDTSPWYPSVRLFRQSKLDDWEPVFARMAEALRQHIGERA